MDQLRIRQRWMPLPWSGIGGVLALVFGGIGVYCSIAYPDDDPSVRVAIPLYLVALYWVVALYFNMRTATITPRSVRVTAGPFPVVPPRQTASENILYCYVGCVRVYDDGTLLGTYETVGVETRDGKQFTLSGPHLIAGEALQAANQIVRVLAPVEVRRIDQGPERGGAGRTLLLGGVWLAIALATIAAGVMWETSF